MPDPMPRRVVRKSSRSDATNQLDVRLAGGRTLPSDGPVDMWVDDVDGDWDDIPTPERRDRPRGFPGTTTREWVAPREPVVKDK